MKSHSALASRFYFQFSVFAVQRIGLWLINKLRPLIYARLKIDVRAKASTANIDSIDQHMIYACDKFICKANNKTLRSDFKCNICLPKLNEHNMHRTDFFSGFWHFVRSQF